MRKLSWVMRWVIGFSVDNNFKRLFKENPKGLAELRSAPQTVVVTRAMLLEALVEHEEFYGVKQPNVRKKVNGIVPSNSALIQQR